MLSVPVARVNRDLPRGLTFAANTAESCRKPLDRRNSSAIMATRLGGGGGGVGVFHSGSQRFMLSCLAVLRRAIAEPQQSEIYGLLT